MQIVMSGMVSRDINNNDAKEVKKKLPLSEAEQYGVLT